MTQTAVPSSESGVHKRPAHHLVTLLVENKAGVLVRVVGLFARRGFNIFSLAVAPTNDDRFSRIAIVVDAESAPLEQILSQLNKLINVVQITELHPDDAREAELFLVTVTSTGKAKSRLLSLVKKSGATVVDEAPGALTVMLAGEPAVLDGFEAELSAFGIVELQRTGRIALPMLRPAVKA